MSRTKKKVLIAAGGTGGHLFPAQALAESLLKKEGIEVLFAAAGLNENRYFQRDKFPYLQIVSASPYASGFFAIWTVLKGVFQSLKLMKKFRPDLIVGFGSFHSFPLLVAGWLKGIPILLFESNSIPGKVNRFFSRWAKLSAVQFAEAKQHLYGDTVVVEIPFAAKERALEIPQAEARSFFGLNPDLLTVLVFGGSQGADAINSQFCEAIQSLPIPVQVIHLTGKKETARKIKQFYQKKNIPAAVKEFEEKMHWAWRAADLAVCRAGAATLGELIAFEVPAILIPFPRASDDHQKRNADFLAKEVKGGVHFPEANLTPEGFIQILSELLSGERVPLNEMRGALKAFKGKSRKKELSQLVIELIQRKR